MLGLQLLRFGGQVMPHCCHFICLYTLDPNPNIKFLGSQILMTNKVTYKGLKDGQIYGFDIFLSKMSIKRLLAHHLLESILKGMEILELFLFTFF